MTNETGIFICAVAIHIVSLFIVYFISQKFIDDQSHIVLAAVPTHQQPPSTVPQNSMFRNNMLQYIPMYDDTHSRYNTDITNDGRMMNNNNNFSYPSSSNCSTRSSAGTGAGTGAATPLFKLTGFV